MRGISTAMIVKLTIGGSSKEDYSPLIHTANFMSSLEFDFLQGRWLRSHNNVDCFWQRNEKFWFAFVLFSIKRLSEKNGDSEQQGSSDNGYTLYQILRAAKLNIVDFFKELPQFVVKAGPTLGNVYGADWENRLEAKEMQANFVHLSLLSQSYKRAIWEFFLTTEANVDKQSTVASASGYVSDHHRFGWLLFLALRIHSFSHFKDLVTCMNGLVSILLRKTAKLQPASECRIGNLENIGTDGLTYFENLLEDSSLSSSLGFVNISGVKVLLGESIVCLQACNLQISWTASGQNNENLKHSSYIVGFWKQFVEQRPKYCMQCWRGLALQLLILARSSKVSLDMRNPAREN
nr:retinoblastoma-related protein [Quercus suber]